MSKKMLFFILPLFFFGMILQPIYGQEELSLEQAIEVGLRNSFQIQIAEKEIEIAHNNNDWGATGRYPEVNLNVFYNNNLATNNNPLAFVNGEFYNGGLVGNIDAGWVIFDGFKVDINKRRLDELERQTNSNSKLVIEDAIQQIINAYYSTLIQQKQFQYLVQTAYCGWNTTVIIVLYMRTMSMKTMLTKMVILKKMSYG